MTSTRTPLSAVLAIPTATVVPAKIAASKLGDVQHPHIWMVIGPAGCGKTTIAKHISERLDLPCVEGDEYHSEANVRKMSEGIPLADSDRWDWLTRLQEECLDRLEMPRCRGIVLTCSALKRKYRDVIRAAISYDHNLIVRFIYLHADESVLVQRVKTRRGHFFGAELVHSQMMTLEPPKPREKDILMVDVSSDIETVKKEVLSKVYRSYQDET